ncbi:DUF938 domain-containing protein [Roseovarius carneus]|uniref:DUF938 domain-containing protein n=1 Tax=Roseovarius carneus TaxID=2853164 RepID=UPI002962017B|nr:DUF938 domain-containing protein [Roseovarius carneus]
MNAPAAARNAAVITAVMQEITPLRGRALEIASGTGQHVVQFAAALPELMWQPTEPDAMRRLSIDAYALRAGLPNLRPALHLDAAKPGWHKDHYGQDLIVMINLLHLISEAEAQTVIHETARALAPGGRFLLYGPFLRDGRATSEGDAAFHASLRASDPEIGYKDTAQIGAWAEAAGLIKPTWRKMPANNLMLIIEAPQPE